MICVAVATSGGRDSTALLYATIRALRGTGADVIALHVHHGLQPEADEWLQRVKRQASRWGARFDFRRLVGSPSPGDSVEAWARNGRYDALREMADAAGCRLVLLAHHRRDQAETWLLQALRGGGAAGLSSMPLMADRNGIVWARPWLHRPRESIDVYIRRHRLSFVDDSSNADVRFARNRLRLLVWPSLTSAFPAAEGALTTAAEHAQRAAALAGEVLAMDLPGISIAGALHVQSWLQLPPARRRNGLQGWLASCLGRCPPNSLCNRLFDELPHCRVGRWATTSGELRLYRGVLRLETGRMDIVIRPASRVNSVSDPASKVCVVVSLAKPGQYELPGWHGTLTIARGGPADAAPHLMHQVKPVERSGGERFRLAPLAVARSLKKQFQHCGVPTWARSGPLLVGLEGQLIFVPGLGIDARAQAGPGHEGLRIVWSSVATGQ